MLVAAALFGLVQGALSTRLRIQAFIVTLAGLQAARGLALIASDNQFININYGEGPGNAPPAFAILGERLFDNTFPVATLVFIGGLGSFHGAIFGAAFIIALPQVIVFMKDDLPASIGQQTGLQPGHPRHCLIGNDKLHLTLASKDLKRLAGGTGLENLVAKVVEHRSHVGENKRVVVDDEHGQALMVPCGHWRRRPGLGCFPDFFCHRQPQFGGCPAALLARQNQASAGVFGQSMHHRQP